MGKKLVVFVDDMNMPRLDAYGTQQPIALLRTTMERRGVYDRGKELSWKHFRDVQYCAAMGPPGGARNPTDPRFLSLFCTFEISFPAAEALQSIYAIILDVHSARLVKEVAQVAEMLPKLMLDFYGHVCQKLPPTPSRFHYIFNLRDLSRVTEGLCLSCVDTTPDPQHFIRLWRNETLRVFHDRLINDEDKAVVNNKLKELIENHFGPHAPYTLVDPCLFGDFRNALEPGQPRLYEDVGNFEEVKTSFDAIMAHMNQTASKPVQLVLFEDALDHLLRVHRVLRLDRGHALLVGVGGSGKQSLARLAASAAECGCFEITLTRGYDEPAFREDLKKLYTILGVENKKTMFLFTDSHVADEGFLELVNNMLASGMPPGLYAEDEKEGLIGSVRDEVQKRGLPDSREALWVYFVEKCRANMHVVLAMSPVGETLRTRCRNFPGLVNNTVIDWYTPWPLQALQSVATAFLEETELPPALRPAIVEHMVMVHTNVREFSHKFQEQLRRSNYVTPKNYLVRAESPAPARAHSRLAHAVHPLRLCRLLCSHR